MSTPSSTRPSRSTSLSRSSDRNGQQSMAPPVPSYPPASNPSPPRSYPAAAHAVSTEHTPLAYDTSPHLDSSNGSSTLPPASHDFADGPYTAIHLGDAPHPYYETAQGRGGSLDLAEDYGGEGDLSEGAPLRASLSTHDSRTHLRSGQTVVTPGGVSTALPTGPDGDLEKHYDSRPLHPGASVQMGALPSRQSGRAERMYGSGEKGGAGSGTGSGYSSPRARSHDRAGSRGGLGQWQGPAGGNSPYGKLGEGQGEDEGDGYHLGANSNPNLAFADGDFIQPGKNWFSRVFFAIYNSSFIIRWIIYIIPVLGLLWVPAIVQFAAAPQGTIWSVPLLWWSIWLTVVWCGWWGAALVAKCGPTVLQNTVGVVAPELRHYIGYVNSIQFYTGAAGWALANWISFLPLIRSRATSSSSNNTLALITQGLFGIFLVLCILLIEKLVIQVIAHHFHKKSYQDRITEQKFQVNALISLYLKCVQTSRSPSSACRLRNSSSRSSRDIGRSDTLDGGMKRPKNRRQVSDPTLLVKKAFKGAKKVAQTATTVIGTVASEIAGERVLQPNSPSSMVMTALQSTNKTKHLARRIYYSFTPKYRDGMVLADIAKCFRNREEAERAFAIFDRDLNGDATLEEVEMACLEIHRQRLDLGRSMRDIDSAVGRLDSIIMSLWYVISILIIVGLLDASFNTLVARYVSRSSLTSAQLVYRSMALTTFIVLQCRHLYSRSGKQVSRGSSEPRRKKFSPRASSFSSSTPTTSATRSTLTATSCSSAPSPLSRSLLRSAEADELAVNNRMHLLSTIFKKIDGTVCQAPHTLLNTKFVQNYRRSGPIWETFTWDVDFGTPFEKIEALRSRMLEFLETEKRDFLPSIDITIQDFDGQGKLTLSAAINYKTSWQNGALKAQRRNKWVCALKVAMGELQIFGPAGAGDPAPAPAEPTQYTLVPYDEIKAKEAAAAKAKENEAPKAEGFEPIGAAAGFAGGMMDSDQVMREEAGEGDGRLRQRRE
ncbi:SPOSA6832_03430, partial [Sporobolomyces salmonicolor]